MSAYEWYSPLNIRLDVRALIIACIIIFSTITWYLRTRIRKLPLQGKRVLLTGAAAGLGRCLAKKLDSLGCLLVCWDLDQGRLDSLKVKLNSRNMHVFQRVDVSKEAEILKALKVMTVSNDFDIIIANAGILSGKSMESIESNDWNRVLHTNLSQQFYLWKHLGMHLGKSKTKHSKLSGVPPTFVMIASVAGLIGLTDLTDYCASKFGVIGFAEGLRLELRKLRSPINTLLVMPFLIDTKMFNGIKLKFPANLLLKPLNKAWVADQIIHGIRTSQTWIVLPWFLRFLPSLLILPVSLRNVVYDMISEHTYMENFVGHQRNNRLTPRFSDSPFPT